MRIDCSGVEELPDGEVVRRAAFDIGSGSSKLQIADVEPESGRILQVLLAEEVPVPFSVDWKQSADGALSDRIQEQGLQVLRKLARKATALGATQSAAVATEVFRKAKNGDGYLKQIKEQLGLQVQLVSQLDEARLGFLTAAALADDDAPRAQLVCWDSGSASFQITRQAPATEAAAAVQGQAEGGAPAPPGGGVLDAYLGALGVGVATHACVEVVQGRSFAEQSSPNPVSLDDAKALVAHLQAQLAPPPSWLLDSRSVVAIGGANSIFALAEESARRMLPTAQEQLESISREQVWRSVEAVVGQSEEELKASYCSAPDSDPPAFVVPKLCLLFAVMEVCRLPHFRFKRAIGSCAGLLIAPEYWP